MNPPVVSSLHTRPPMFAQHQHQHQHGHGHGHGQAPPPPVPHQHVQPLQPAAVPTHRSEGDIQWIVGWVRDLLVIAMSVGNLAHLGSH